MLLVSVKGKRFGNTEAKLAKSYQSWAAASLLIQSQFTVYTIYKLRIKFWSNLLWRRSHKLCQPGNASISRDSLLVVRFWSLNYDHNIWKYGEIYFNKNICKTFESMSCKVVWLRSLNISMVIHILTKHLLYILKFEKFFMVWFWSLNYYDNINLKAWWYI